MDRHRLARPVHKHPFSGHMHLAQHRIQRARPLPIELAKAAVGVALRMSLAVLLPEQLQRYPFAPQLLVGLRPVRQILHSLARHWPGRTAQELGEQLLFAQLLGHWPTQPRRLGSLEVVAHRAGRQRATARDLSNREMVLMFEFE